MLNNRGLNLIEVVIASAITLVVFGAMLVVFNSGRNTYFTTETRVTTREESRKAFEIFDQDLRDARLMSWCFESKRPK